MEQKYLGSGAFANCYLYKNRVMKIYKNQISASIFDPKMVGIKNDTYIFPDEIIYDNGKVAATLMKYIPSLSFDKINWNYKDLISSIDKVYEDTDKLSDMGIKSNDVYAKNMFYKSRIFIGDVDFYMFYEHKNLKAINISNFNQAIYENIFNILYISKSLVIDDILSTKELQELKKLIFSDSVDNKILKEFLILLKKSLESCVNYEIKDYKSLRRSIKSFVK